MAQTPISASVEVLKGTTTLYTVPSGKTAIIKAVLGGSVVGNTPTYTVNKVSGGTSYPIAVSQTVSQVQATGGTTINNANLLQAPVTLAAGESITVYTEQSDSLQIPQVAVYSNTTPFTFYINQIQFANSIFMASGYFGVNSALVLTSSDGVTWTKQNLASTVPRFLSVSYGNGAWVAIPNGINDILYVSSDNGVTWSSVNVTTSAGVYCTAVTYLNSQWISCWTSGYMFTTTTPATAGWTSNTAWRTYVRSNSAQGNPQSIGYNGTNYIFTGRYIGIIYSPNLSTFTSYGNTGGGYYMQGAIQTVGIAYSSAYSKWYCNTRGSSLTDSVYTSTDSVNWTKTTTPAYTSSASIQVAGSNPILLIQNTNGTTSTGAASAYMKSTDGTTWAVANDVSGYSGPLIGLSNGYFVKFISSSNGGYNLTTDPTSSAGTTRASTTTYYGINVGASNGTKWIAFGRNASNDYISMTGGANGTTASSWYQSSGGYDVNGYGYPHSACWNPTDGYFYMITRIGVIFKIDGYGSDVAYVTQIGNSTDTYTGIAYLNGFLYATTARTTTTQSRIYISSDYATFDEFSLGGSTYNVLGAQKAEFSSFYYASQNFAVNGTTSLAIVSQWGWTYNLNATDPYTPYYYPQGVMHYQRANSVDIFAGGYDLAGSQLYGLWQYSSGFTTTPVINATSFMFNNQTPNIDAFFAYIGSKYYAVTNDGSMTSGSTLTTLASLAFSSSSPNGVSYTSAASYSQIQTNGSNFYYYPRQNISTNGSLSMGATGDLTNAINNSVMTGSIIQID